MSHRKQIISAAVGGALLLILPSASASYVSVDKKMPSPVYTDVLPLEEVSFNYGMIIRNMQFTASGPRIDVAPATPFMISSFFDIFIEVSTDGGGSFSPLRVRESPTLLTGMPSAGVANTHEVELSGLDGGIRESPTMIFIRESPTIPSRGMTSVTPVATEYVIESFFDVWTELSIDGGATWLPPTSYSPDGGQTWINEPRPLHLVGTPEPASAALFALTGALVCRRRRN